MAPATVPDQWLAWAADPSGPAVLVSGIRFRALLPSGPFEPDCQPDWAAVWAAALQPHAEPAPPVTSDWGHSEIGEANITIPWPTIALCASGWLVAIHLMLLR